MNVTHLNPKAKAVALTVLLGGIAVIIYYLPYWISDYNMNQVNSALYLSIGVLSMNLVVGMTGQLSLGQGAFYGIGAYSVILLVEHGWPYWAAICVAVLIAGAVGLLVGIPAARIRGLYLAVTTLALGIAFPAMLIRFAGVTGGNNGMLLNPLLTTPTWFSGTADQWLFYLTAIMTALSILIVRNMLHSNFGRGMIAVRDHQTLASIFGVHVTRTKIIAFGVSAALTGLAGTMFILQTQFASPGEFTFSTSLNFFVGMAIGGSVSVYGAIIGGFFLEFSQSWIASIGLGSWSTPVVYGALLIVVVYFLPQGIGGSMRAGTMRLIRAGSARMVSKKGGDEAIVAASTE